MKKKIICAALALLMLFIFSACGNGTVADVAVPSGMQLISPDTADYYLFVSEDWKSDISTGVVTAYYSDKDPTNICLMVFSLGGESMTYADYWKRYEGQFSEVYSNYKLEESSETVLDGVTSGKFVYTASFGASAEESSESEPAAGDYKFVTVVTIKEDNIYILTYSATASAYESHLNDFSDVILNFKFKK